MSTKIGDRDDKILGSDINEENSIQGIMMQILEKRGHEKTCCPSEVARKFAPQGWRAYMEPTRNVARQLAEKGQIDICQGGEIVTGTAWKGPIRLRLRKQHPAISSAPNP